MTFPQAWCGFQMRSRPVGKMASGHHRQAGTLPAATATRLIKSSKSPTLTDVSAAFPYEVGDLLANHYRSGVRVRTDAIRHDGGVGYPQSLHTFYSQELVNPRSLGRNLVPSCKCRIHGEMYLSCAGATRPAGRPIAIPRQKALSCRAIDLRSWNSRRCSHPTV